MSTKTNSPGYRIGASSGQTKSSRPYPGLCAAVVDQGCRDYYSALRVAKMIPENTKNKSARSRRDRALYRISECEEFFRKNLWLYSDLDGEAIIKEIRERAGR